MNKFKSVSQKDLLLVVLLWMVSVVLASFAFGQDEEAELIKRIGEAQWAKETKLINYSVSEEYSVLRNGGSQPAATLKVRTSYTHDKGKDYSKVVSRSGSPALQRLLLNRILKGEEEISQMDSRKHILITSDNYTMRRSGEDATIQGRKCRVLELVPRAKSPYLLQGRVWVDSQTYEVIRIEGRPSARPSIWTGRPLITRDYVDIAGFPLAVSARVEANSLFFGTTVVVIEYKDYEVNHLP
jgi:hypothetical protein